MQEVIGTPVSCNLLILRRKALFCWGTYRRTYTPLQAGAFAPICTSTCSLETIAAADLANATQLHSPHFTVCFHIFKGSFFSITWGLIFIACLICLCALTIFSLPAYLCMCALTSFHCLRFLCVLSPSCSSTARATTLSKNACLLTQRVSPSSSRYWYVCQTKAWFSW